MHSNKMILFYSSEKPLQMQCQDGFKAGKDYKNYTSSYSIYKFLKSYGQTTTV